MKGVITTMTIIRSNGRLKTIKIRRHKTREELRRRVEAICNIVTAVIVAAGLVLCGMGIGAWLG